MEKRDEKRRPLFGKRDIICSFANVREQRTVLKREHRSIVIIRLAAQAAGFF